jgi:hypothetical protein
MGRRPLSGASARGYRVGLAQLAEERAQRLGGLEGRRLRPPGPLARLRRQGGVLGEQLTVADEAR